MRLQTAAFLLFLIPFHCAARSFEEKPREVNEDPIHQINGVGVEILKSKDEPKTVGDHPVNEARDEGSPNLHNQPPVNGAGDEGNPNLDNQPPLNGAGDESSPNLHNQPPVNGAGDEGSPNLEAQGRLQVNGHGNALEKTYDSVDIPADIDTRMFEAPWRKYSEATHWCTISGRSLISMDTSNPITAAECHKRCVRKNPRCMAVEFWEKYNWACFECTNPLLITPYTYTADLAYPVYVWARGRWFKYSQKTHWCTISGRSLISMDTNKEINAVQCQISCQIKNPECRAVEFWEKYNWACFECTDPSLITPYTYTADLAYPVYVWVRDG